MRAVMREALGLLAWGGFSALLQGQETPEAATLSYQDFSWLRPNYAESSWRVILGKLVLQRDVLKTTRDGRVAFQLTRKGWSQIRRSYLLFSGEEDKEWMMLLLKPLSGQKHTLPEAKRLAVAEGFVFVSSQAAICPKAAYSDYLASNIQKEGYQALFLPIQPGRAMPVSISEFVESSDRLFRLDREREKISKEINILLKQVTPLKVLKNQTKMRIGSTVVSGLSFFAQLNLLDLERPQNRTAIAELLQNVDSLMREYSAKNYA